MKKELKYYLLISSIIIVIINIYVIINAEYILSNDFVFLRGITPEALLKRKLDLYESGGVKSIYIGAILAITTNILAIFLLIKNKINKFVTVLMVLNLICAMVARNVYSFILLSINWLLFFIIRKRVETESKEEIRDVPKIKRLKPSRKNIIWGFFLVIIYFVFYFFKVGIVESGLKRDISIIIVQLVTFVLAILTFKDILKRDIKLLGKYFKEYTNCMFRFVKKYIFVIGITAITGILLTNQATSVNQEKIEQIPFMKLFFSAVFFAPIVEECIFRGFLRFFLKNKIMYILFSGSIFGILHVISEVSLINMILLGLPYISIGCMLAHVYVKTNNLAVNMLLHLLNNLLVVIMLMMFG